MYAKIAVGNYDESHLSSFMEEQFQYIVNQLYVRSFHFVSSNFQLFRNKTLVSSDQAIQTTNKANKEGSLTTASVRYIDATIVL